jgi:hypothetical protein
MMKKKGVVGKNVETTGISCPVLYLGTRIPTEAGDAEASSGTDAPKIAADRLGFAPLPS